MFRTLKPFLVNKTNLYTQIQKAKFSNYNNEISNLHNQITNLHNQIKNLEYDINFIYGRLLTFGIISSLLLWFSIPTERRLHEHMNKLSKEIKNNK